MSVAALTNFDVAQFANTLVSLTTAFVLGTAIGAERQWRQRTAGLRTAALVAVGAAAFVDIGMRLNGTAAAVHVLAYVVSGVGFLGAGVIMKEGLNIRGLNTAATLWGSAAAGGAAGADLIGEAVVIAVFVLMANTALRPLVDRINRQPLDEATTEATYELRITVSPEEMPVVRGALLDRLDAKSYAVRGTAVAEQTEDSLELAVTLAGSSARPGELDEIVDAIGTLPGVDHASWAMRTAD
ncbi:MgtC/SapB family protein [Rhodoplanes sp. TEM]|uniref:Protein MgtC n=1 Tax=Rhodoplanes tepidamans TaxID=200616 RepID=A0ABT5JFB7_RHOTP|nr:MULTISPECIES: MgtC/SapB family protein [Rhodoplanes]MDC7788183.1 MgtC/SapB family protein [Rhodoplanes tepidamans]MDC7986508.1 MgtC/SapB family protein [Rhodoplanes sp. TEM]MDQ0355127.1 putative Mg2+ transporter-C (MgtC) family protein [Rhodoplanes tepidamans]